MDTYIQFLKIYIRQLTYRKDLPNAQTRKLNTKVSLIILVDNPLSPISLNLFDYTINSNDDTVR